LQGRNPIFRLGKIAAIEFDYFYLFFVNYISYFLSIFYSLAGKTKSLFCNRLIMQKNMVGFRKV